MNKRKNVLLIITMCSVLLLTNTIFAVTILNHKTMSFSFESVGVEPIVNILYYVGNHPNDCSTDVSLYGNFDASNIDFGDIEKGESSRICFLITSDTDNVEVSVMASITPGNNIDDLVLNIPSDIDSGNTFGNIDFYVTEDIEGNNGETTEGEIVFGITY